MKPLFGWFATASVTVAALAADAPLDYRRLTLEETFAYPGDRGRTANLTVSRPARSSARPPAVSRRPLYGNFGVMERAGARRTLFFRLDESQGTGRGYDQLIVDLNGNGDLIDDPVLSKVGEIAPRTENGESARFGPFTFAWKIPGTTYDAAWCAEMELPDRAALKGAVTRDQVLGTMRFRSGWLLEATVEVNGVKEQVAFVDGNCNLLLPDRPTRSRYPGEAAVSDRWYLSPGDYVLRSLASPDRARLAPYTSAEPWHQTLCLGGTPCNVTVNSNLTAVHVEPFTGPCGSLAAEPHFQDLLLARRIDADSWEPFRPHSYQGRWIMPAGAYRLLRYRWREQDTAGAVGEVRCTAGSEKVFTIASGTNNAIPFGLPMELTIAARKESVASGGGMGTSRNLFGGTANGALTVVMNLKIVGRGEERFSGYYQLTTNKAGQARYASAKPPRFLVLDSQGKEVASGSFEFG